MRVLQLLPVVLLAACVFLGSAMVEAGTQDQAKLALHAVPHSSKGCGKNDPVTLNLPCSSFNTYADLSTGGRDIYLVVGQANATAGIGGLSVGMTFDYGIMSTWTPCANLEFRNSGWPASGGGNRITWAVGTNCQRTVIGSDGAHATAGFFYMYAYDPGEGMLRLTQNPIGGGELQVADCNAAESNITLSAVGRCALSGAPSRRGCNPCLEDCLGPIPTLPTTWGRLKDQYSSN